MNVFTYHPLQAVIVADTKTKAIADLRRSLKEMRFKHRIKHKLVMPLYTSEECVRFMRKGSSVL